MDVVRVSVVALVACSTAGADPAVPPGHVQPEGWRQLPAIASAVGAAARSDGVTIDAIDAWGEPARGCYAVWLALHGGKADAPALAEQVLASVSRAATRSEPRAARPPEATAGRSDDIALGDIVKPVDRTGVLAFAFTRPPYQGRVRAQLGGGRIAAVACFSNEREPRACTATCAQVLEPGPEARPAAAAGRSGGATTRRPAP